MKNFFTPLIFCFTKIHSNGGLCAKDFFLFSIKTEFMNSDNVINIT